MPEGGGRNIRPAAALVAGIAAAGLFSVVWVFLKLPLAVLLTLAVLWLVITLAGFTVAVGWWDQLQAPGRRRKRRKRLRAVHEDENTALARACQVAAEGLDQLLARHGYPSFIGWFATRKLLRDYEKTQREQVEGAIALAWAIVTVPSEVRRCAQDPHSVAELERVRDWLRSMTEDRAVV